MVAGSLVVAGFMEVLVLVLNTLVSCGEVSRWSREWS